MFIDSRGFLDIKLLLCNKRENKTNFTSKDLNDDFGLTELLVGWQVDDGGVDVVGADQLAAGSLATTQFQVSFSLGPIAKKKVGLVEEDEASEHQAKSGGEEERRVSGVVVVLLVP